MCTTFDIITATQILCKNFQRVDHFPRQIGIPGTQVLHSLHGYFTRLIATIYQLILHSQLLVVGSLPQYSIPLAAIAHFDPSLVVYGVYVCVYFAIEVCLTEHPLHYSSTKYWLVYLHMPSTKPRRYITSTFHFLSREVS